MQEVNVHIPPQPQPQPQPRSAGAADPCDVSAKSRSDLEQLCMDKPNYNMSLMKCYVERKIDAQVQKVCLSQIGD